MGCAYKGRELFFTAPEFEGKIAPKAADADLARVRREWGFKLYGGSKTWLSPQEDWPAALPFYDLDSGEWSLAQSSSRNEVVIALQSPVCRESGAQIRKEFTLGENSSVRIRETLTNASSRPMRHGLWHVTQLDRPGTVFVPVAASSRFERGVKIFGEETPDPAAARRKLFTREGHARIECDEDVRFKFGTDSDAGWIVGFLPWEKSRWIVFKKRFQIFPGAPFGHDCSAEVFNSNETANFEIEIHGPVRNLAPGESCAWESSWHFSEASRLPQSAAELDLFVH
jgi:hypothetical protein